MNYPLEDIFDIDQIIPPLSPLSPTTQAFIDTFDLSAFNAPATIGTEDIYYQDVEQSAGDMPMTDIITEGQSFLGLFQGNTYEDEQTPTRVSNDIELFGTGNDYIGVQAAQDLLSFGGFSPEIETMYTNIDDALIDPELHMLDSPNGPTPSRFSFYAPQQAQYTTKNTEIYEPITLSSPTQNFESNMPYQISSLSQFPATGGSTRACSEKPKDSLVPIDCDDFFQPTATPPRIRIDGTYAIENNKTGSICQYTTYTPLPTWYAPGFGASGINYNNLGFLNKEIRFTSPTLTSFIRHHPLGPKLILRIEKQPYEVKGRFLSAKSTKGKPKYTSCRDANCVLGGSLKVGELRVAIDEITGRFQENDEQDNDPYFSCGFLHLQCFESLINIAPLVHMNLLIPDLRKEFTKEPPCGKGLKNNNKMALNSKESNAFTKWLESSTPSQGQVLGRGSLTSNLWLSNCKKSRTKCIQRAPPGVTQEDIDTQNRTRGLWGGRRAVGRSVAEMNRLEEEGRCNELIAPRNGISGKLGMGPTGATALRFLKRKGQSNEPRRVRKRARESTPPLSSPDPNLRKAMLRSPPQKRKKHNAPSDINIYSTPKRVLSPVTTFSPSLTNWSLLDTPSVNKNFVTMPLGPKSSQPPTPTASRRSPRLHKKIDYTDFDSDEGEGGAKGDNKENGDWRDLFEEFLF